MLALQVLLRAPELVVHNQDIEALLIGLRENGSENVTQIVERSSPGLFPSDSGELGQVSLPRLRAVPPGDPGCLQRAYPFPSGSMVGTSHVFTLNYHAVNFLAGFFRVASPENVLQNVIVAF